MVPVIIFFLSTLYNLFWMHNFFLYFFARYFLSFFFLCILWKWMNSLLVVIYVYVCLLVFVCVLSHTNILFPVFFPLVFLFLLPSSFLIYFLFVFFSLEFLLSLHKWVVIYFIFALAFSLFSLEFSFNFVGVWKKIKSCC